MAENLSRTESNRQREILWVGKTDKVPAEYSQIKGLNLKEKTLTPELVDSHTHLIFAGDRSSEYSMRLNGESYENIAKAGGGILSTVKSTNQASRDELFKLACQRIEKIYSYGVGTIEIKSGYGLNFEKEKELSLIINDLKRHFSPKIQIINTFMAAHAIPKEYKKSNDYLRKEVIPLLEELADKKIIDIVDIFHEESYFDSEDTHLLFEVAKKFEIPCKSHADEFKDNDGASLAVKYGCLSCDHLLKTSVSGIKDLSSSPTIATLLPATAFFLGKEQVNARRFLDNGVKVAIASDYNPGSSHYDNLLMIASITAPTYKMNQAELWSAITLNSAHALGLKKQGCLIPGMKSRFSIFNCNSLDKITYSWGVNFFQL